MPCGVGGGTHRSWPPGGRPRCWLQERVTGSSPRALGSGTVSFFWGSGKGWLGGARARVSVPGGVGAPCVVFLSFLTRTKRRKMAFFEGCLWGGGGTHRSWPGGRGVDQGPWLQERVGGDAFFESWRVDLVRVAVAVCRGARARGSKGFGHGAQGCPVG